MYHRALILPNTLKLDITLPLATHSLAWRTQARLSDACSGLLDPEGGIVKLALRQHFTRFLLKLYNIWIHPQTRRRGRCFIYRIDAQHLDQQHSDSRKTWGHRCGLTCAWRAPDSSSMCAGCSSWSWRDPDRERKTTGSSLPSPATPPRLSFFSRPS